jgi:glutaredoxin
VSSPSRSFGFIALLFGILFSGASSAQFKWQNPDGTVGYGDLPPAHHVKMLKTPSGEVTPQATAEADGSGLPYALKQASTRFPVVLYTGNAGSGDCGPCKEGREYLNKRGIPFTERLVKTAEDVKAFKANVSPEGTVPAVTVGKEKTVGFEAGSWSNLLDAAGYPKTSVLPKNFKQANADTLTKPLASDQVKAEKDAKPNPKGKLPAPAQPVMVDANANANLRF